MIMSGNISFTCYLPIIGETIKYIDQWNNSSQNERKFSYPRPFDDWSGLMENINPVSTPYVCLVYGKTKLEAQPTEPVSLTWQ